MTILYGRSVTILLAVIQILASVGCLFLTGCFQLVFVVFGGVDNLSEGMVFVMLKMLFYIFTGIALIANFRFSIILAYIAAIMGIISNTVYLLRGEAGMIPDVTIVFYSMYLAWFIAVYFLSKEGSALKS